MESHVTSFAALFDGGSTDGLEVVRVEIPVIQRDYAQGRDSASVERIRTEFLQALRDAVTGAEPISLDFVYGGVKGGTLQPLDGQQRLTTLFLLHWYLASRTDNLGADHGWTNFTYATRPGARLFCERLVENPLPAGREDVSAWIRDQPWYQYTWSHGPTIQAMLVMLDAIQDCFGCIDHVAAWQKLVDRQNPAISFHLLPLDGESLDEDRYIKMNSRGKPLTDFENFKARFEQLLERSCPDRAAEFAKKVDGDWADMLWPYHGGDYLVDDEFLRYFHFLTEVREWREAELDLLDEDETGLTKREAKRLRFAERDIGPLAEEVYTGDAAAERLDFLIRGFDTWVGVDIQATFDELFAESATGGPEKRPVIFGSPPNLFDECCRKYGEVRGNNRSFSLAQSLYLYAVLWHRLNETDDTPRRLRILRNLIEASGSQLRGERMRELLAGVETIMSTGSVEGVEGFNPGQLEEEAHKARLIESKPHLEAPIFQLEDEPTLRGNLVAFDLDTERLGDRRAAFHTIFSDDSLWKLLTGALLAKGDYWRQLNSRFFQFGAPKAAARWRDLFTGASRDRLAGTREALQALLDDFVDRDGDPAERLIAISRDFLAAREADGALDWRYYFVKYPCMREGATGLYVPEDGELGYSVCMLRKTVMRSWYRDPFALAVYRLVDRKDRLDDPWFWGYESEPRWLRLSKTGIGLRSVDSGFELDVPYEAGRTLGLERVSEEFGLVEIGDVRSKETRLLLGIPRVRRGRRFLDTTDRVVTAARLVEELIRHRL